MNHMYMELHTIDNRVDNVYKRYFPFVEISVNVS